MEQMKPESVPVPEEAGAYTMEEVFEIAKAKRLTDKQNYLLSWLTAPPAQLRCAEIDPGKRFETVLSVLRKDRSRNVIPFKPRSRK
ncbi:MAG: hypothetical protein A2V53_02225 [Deltaproteobacteria bacterium RBG_19FT_COMBO_56_10]|nr:MAG: hypothetical protein A2V53_02225 [Deltaproteobacteria bacterium RBG_19FT_COMBO_56_10]